MRFGRRAFIKAAAGAAAALFIPADRLEFGVPRAALAAVPDPRVLDEFIVESRTLDFGADSRYHVFADLTGGLHEAYYAGRDRAIRVDRTTYELTDAGLLVERGGVKVTLQPGQSVQWSERSGSEPLRVNEVDFGRDGYVTHSRTKIDAAARALPRAAWDWERFPDYTGGG